MLKDKKKPAIVIAIGVEKKKPMKGDGKVDKKVGSKDYDMPEGKAGKMPEKRKYWNARDGGSR